MIKTDNSEAFRQSRIERIQYEQGERTANLRKLRQEMEALDALEDTLMQRLRRAQRLDPSLGMCPRCAIDDGVTSEMKPLSVGMVVIDDLPVDVDLMQCPICRWDDTVTP